jgi:cation/acetate symporter
VTQHDLSDAQIDRAQIDGGFGFALAAFVLGLGILAVLDRIGLPDDILRIGVLALIFSGLVVIALLMRTMRPLDFYAGGRRLPASYAGIVFAGSGFGLFMPFLPPLPPGISFVSIAIGFCLGFLWLLFGAGPILRRSGAYSFADLIGTRFAYPSVRIPIVLIIASCAACVALGGYEIALRGFVATLGVHRIIGAIILGGLLVLLVVPAGLSGVMWISAAAAVVTVAALALPLGFGLISGQPVALPIFGDQMLWSRAIVDFAVVTGADRQPGFEIAIVITFGIGVAMLAPLFGAAIASRDEATAWRSGLAGTVWLVLGALLIAGTLAGATLAITTGVDGHAPSNLPAALLKASGRGEIAICGVHARDAAALNRACANKVKGGQPLDVQDISTNGDALLTSLPVLRGSESSTLARLAGAFMIILGMGLAASGIQFVTTSLAHDLAQPYRRPGPVSRRLAFARAVAIGCIALASLWLALASVDARFLFTLALMLSTALVAPLLALALVPQATSLGAFAALCVGSFVMAHFFIYNAALMPLGRLASDAAFAATDGFAVGLFITFLPAKRPTGTRVASTRPGENRPTDVD